MKNSKRIAIISDIHGNLPALKAVLSDINKSSIGSIICLGDIATLGPSPIETLQLIKNLNCPCILGNHEEAMLNPIKADEFNIKGEVLQNTLNWCLDKITHEDLEFISKFKRVHRMKLTNSLPAICYHGSPKSSIDTILPSTTAEELNRFIDLDSLTKVYIGGHTHFQMFRKYRDKTIINTGSVGCAFVNPSYSPPSPSLLPVAEYIIIEVVKENISVELKSVKYDFDEFKLLVNKSDIPLKEWWNNEFKRIG